VAPHEQVLAAYERVLGLIIPAPWGRGTMGRSALWTSAIRRARSLRRHPWLPSLLITRSVLSPNGLVLLEHVLKALAPHLASLTAKLEAFAILGLLCS
jgi:hypothetical protein